MALATRRQPAGDGVRRDALWAGAETAALFLIFIASFTGRDAFSDGVKTFLTALSVLVGGLGTAGALLVARRGLANASGRLARFALAGWMGFAGIYTIVHVLS